MLIWPGLLANTAIYGGVWWAMLFGPGVFIRWRRRRAGRCAKCGYDLPRHRVAGVSGMWVCTVTLAIASWIVWTGVVLVALLVVAIAVESYFARSSRVAKRCLPTEVGDVVKRLCKQGLVDSLVQFSMDSNRDENVIQVQKHRSFDSPVRGFAVSYRIPPDDETVTRVERALSEWEVQRSRDVRNADVWLVECNENAEMAVTVASRLVQVVWGPKLKSSLYYWTRGWFDPARPKTPGVTTDQGRWRLRSWVLVIIFIAVVPVLFALSRNLFGQTWPAMIVWLGVVLAIKLLERRLNRVAQPGQQVDQAPE